MRAILIAVCGTAVFAAACFFGWMQFTGRVDVLQALRPEGQASQAEPPQIGPASTPGRADVIQPPGETTRIAAPPPTRAAAAPDDEWERDPWDRARRPWSPQPPAVPMAEMDVLNATGGPVSFEVDSQSRQIHLFTRVDPSLTTLDMGGSQLLTLVEGEYLVLVDGQTQGAPVAIEADREHTLEFRPAGEGPGQGTMVRLMREGRTLFRTWLRPAPPPPPSIVYICPEGCGFTAREQGFCPRCRYRLVAQAPQEPQPVARPVEPAPPPGPAEAFLGMMQMFLSVRYVCEDCREVHASGGT